MSGRRSRAVRATSAVVLFRGIEPTAFNFSGTKKARCFPLPVTARIATSSHFTPNIAASFSENAVSDAESMLAECSAQRLTRRFNSAAVAKAFILFLEGSIQGQVRV